MPELPEVHTTASILNKLIKGQKIKTVWTDFNSNYYKGKENIKDPVYFKKFSREITGKKIIKVWRRAKNILLELEDEQTILIHMKMTGQLLYGKYRFNKKNKTWSVTTKGPLQNPTSRFIHLVFELSSGKSLVLSDMRKFSTIKLISDKKELETKLGLVGPEPLDKNFTWLDFKTQLLKKSQGKIKTVLMNSNIIAGIGNIYSDEILWKSFIHPERIVSKISDKEFQILYKNTKELLKKGIILGGDSMSDYRNPYGEKGQFQLHHKVYGRKNEKCLRTKCNNLIERKVINGRSSHFCKKCQK